jgi:hypothetical protein
MLNSIANAIIALKQRAVEVTAKRLINRRIAPFGSVTSLHIDSKERTLFAQLALKGETQPIEIKIGSYEVIQENGLDYIIFQNLHASKEWIGSILNEYVAGRRFKVPAMVRLALSSSMQAWL